MLNINSLPEKLPWVDVDKFTLSAIRNRGTKDEENRLPIPFDQCIVVPEDDELIFKIKTTIQRILSRTGYPFEVVEANMINADMINEKIIGIVAPNQQSIDMKTILRNSFGLINDALGEQQLPKLADIPVPQETVVK